MCTNGQLDNTDGVFAPYRAVPCNDTIRQRKRSDALRGWTRQAAGRATRRRTPAALNTTKPNDTRTESRHCESGRRFRTVADMTTRSSNFNHPDARDNVHRRTIKQSTTNPQSMGLDKASEHSRPFIGTPKAVPRVVGRKPGQLFR